MKDTALYRCDECFEKLCIQRFQQKQLHNVKYIADRNRLTCKTCVSQRPQRLTKLRPRVLRSKRRCHCNRHSAPGMHVESCLASDKESSGRWPGSDEGVTVHDFRFYNGGSLFGGVTRWAKQQNGSVRCSARGHRPRA